MMLTIIHVLYWVKLHILIHLVNRRASVEMFLYSKNELFLLHVIEFRVLNSIFLSWILLLLKGKKSVNFLKEVISSLPSWNDWLGHCHPALKIFIGMLKFSYGFLDYIVFLTTKPKHVKCKKLFIVNFPYLYLTKIAWNSIKFDHTYNLLFLFSLL